MRKIISLADIKFLAVDDNAFSRSIIKTILRSLGVGADNLREAQNGAEALDLLQISTPDIAIFDYMMDPINGIELTKKIRREMEPPLQTMPIIMLSAFTEIDLVTEARDAGVTEYVSKPISVAALYLRIEAVVLRPRQFVIAENFCGPDRRRRDETFEGPERRETPAQIVGPPAEDEDEWWKVEPEDAPEGAPEEPAEETPEEAAEEAPYETDPISQRGI